jgi:hypothetical protein
MKKNAPHHHLVNCFTEAPLTRTRWWVRYSVSFELFSVDRDRSRCELCNVRLQTSQTAKLKSEKNRPGALCCRGNVRGDDRDRGNRRSRSTDREGKTKTRTAATMNLDELADILAHASSHSHASRVTHATHTHSQWEKKRNPTKQKNYFSLFSICCLFLWERLAGA